MGYLYKSQPETGMTKFPWWSFSQHKQAIITDIQEPAETTTVITYKALSHIQNGNRKSSTYKRYHERNEQPNMSNVPVRF